MRPTMIYTALYMSTIYDSTILISSSVNPYMRRSILPSAAGLDLPLQGLFLLRRTWTLLGSRKNSSQKTARKCRRIPSVQCIIPAIVRDALLGRCSMLGCPVSNRIRTSRFRFATADRPEQDRESHSEAAHVAIDTPSDLPCPVHSQRRLPVQP